MRPLVLACVVILASQLRPPDAAARPDDPGATLSAKEVATYFQPYVPEVKQCYLASAHGKDVDGTLRLELIIHPSGVIYKFGFVAPGITEPWLGKLETCLRTLSSAWHLPARSGYTTAVLPFLFQRTNAPGAGPIESCWDPRGCPPGKPGGAR
jgi:hypothetical protein